MELALKNKWIEALRSGEYLQGKGALREAGRGGKADKYCCLGVLIDIADAERWIEHDVNPGENIQAKFTDSHGTGDNHAEGELEGDLKDICDLTKAQSSMLITLNDGIRYGCASNKEGAVQSSINPDFTEGKEPQDFNAIADYIEANL